MIFRLSKLFVTLSPKFCFLVLTFVTFPSALVQEEIKIIDVEVYVNPYAESDDEEDREKPNDENKIEDEDNVSYNFLEHLASELFINQSLLSLLILFPQKCLFFTSSSHKTQFHVVLCCCISG